MLNIEAKEFIPKNEYIKNWENNEKIILKEFGIEDEDIDWKNIECDIHLMNLDQNYENFMLKINEASGYHNFNKLNIMKKYMY
jgi:hypothetical protein